MFLNKDNSIKWKWLLIASVITVALCVIGVFWLDKPVFEFLRRFDWQPWQFFDVIFAAKMWLYVSALFMLLIAVRNKNKLKFKLKINLKQNIADFKQIAKNNYGMMIFLSVLVASIIAGIAKFGLGRARPIFFEALGHTGFYPGTAEWAFNSMPSGHTTASFAGLVMIGMLFPKIKWGTWTLAIIIGVSRICAGAHWPSDVILGAFIGMVVADMVKSKLKRTSVGV